MNNLNKIIIGSTALRLAGYSFTPKDFDVFIDDISIKSDGEDYILIPTELLQKIPYFVDTFTFNHPMAVATPDAIYTIKCSHLGWDINWSKHKDNALFLKRHGAMLIPELYDSFVEYWKSVNGNKPQLDMYKTKSEFFNNAVPLVIEHDDLHKISVYPDEPLYLKVLEDNQEVALSECKFNQLTFEEQVRLFKEEIAVIAVERWLINPKLKKEYHWMEAWNLSLHKTVVDLTKDWYTDFMVKNLEQFVVPDFELFRNFYDKGILKMKKIDSGLAIDLIATIIRCEEGVNIFEVYDIQNDGFNGWVYNHFINHTLGVVADDHFKVVEPEKITDGNCSIVFKWKDHYYKLIFPVNSHYGEMYGRSELFEVEPKVKKITIYE